MFRKKIDFLLVFFSALLQQHVCFAEGLSNTLKTRSRWAVFTELGPGVEDISEFDLQKNAEAEFAERIGVSFYGLDLCNKANVNSSCVDLSIHIFIGFLHRLDPVVTDMLKIGTGIDMSFYFGGQRVVAWNVQHNVGYGYNFERTLPDNIQVKTHIAFLSLGTGVRVHPIPKEKGFELYARVDWFVNTKTFLFPIGIRYRF